MDQNSNSKWHSIVDSMSLFFVCDHCGYRFEGSRQNRGMECPGCGLGLLRFTKQTGLFLAKKWSEFKATEERSVY